MALLGQMLVDRGVLTERQLSDALEAQKRLTEQGLDKLLGDLLVAKGFATAEQIRQVLEEQQRRVVTCGACRGQFSVFTTDIGRVVSCPRCGRDVQVPQELKDFNLALPVTPVYIDAGAVPVAYVVVKHFDAADEVVALKDGDDLMAGTGSECKLHVEGEGVEETHCRLTVAGGTVLLADLSRKEGVYVNGRKVSKCTLSFGDLVLLGRAPLMVTAGLGAGRGADDVGPLARDNLLDADPANLVGRTVGRYRFVRLLGSGGMAMVLLAEQTTLNRLVAVKVLRREMTPSRKAVDRFVREALAGAQLNHANIVQTYDAGTLGGLLFIAMEYVEGEDVGQWIRRFGKLPVSLSLSIGIQVAVAMDFAHQKGVIHRDIKPSNIMFTRDGRVKILDLGIARVLHEASPESATSGVGTLVYMPPEQTKDAAHVDHRADVYALGATLYKMLAGAPPFARKGVDAMIKAVRYDKAPDPRTLNPDIPAGVVDILTTAMAKKPEVRIQTMREFQDRLVTEWNKLT
jgi:hypothetical protein